MRAMTSAYQLVALLPLSHGVFAFSKNKARGRSFNVTVATR